VLFAVQDAAEDAAAVFETFSSAGAPFPRNTIALVGHFCRAVSAASVG